MSTDDKGQRLGDDFSGRPANEFAPATIATVYADGVTSYAFGPGLVKTYFYRTDPNMFGRGG